MCNKVRFRNKVPQLLPESLQSTHFLAFSWQNEVECWGTIPIFVLHKLWTWFWCEVPTIIWFNRKNIYHKRPQFQGFLVSPETEFCKNGDKKLHQNKQEIKDKCRTCDAARWKPSLVNRPCTFAKLIRANENGDNFFLSSAKFLNSSNVMRTSLNRGSLFISSTRSSNLPRWLRSAEATIESAKSLADMVFLAL